MDLILSGFAFKQFKIFPLIGRMACVFLSLACLADPAAESPSTINSSHSSTFLELQAANFPGRTELNTDIAFLRVASRALFAASLALRVNKALLIIALASFGLLSNQTLNYFAANFSAIVRPSLEVKTSLFCP